MNRCKERPNKIIHNYHQSFFTNEITLIIKQAVGLTDL